MYHIILVALPVVSFAKGSAGNPVNSGIRPQEQGLFNGEIMVTSHLGSNHNQQNQIIDNLYVTNQKIGYEL